MCLPERKTLRRTRPPLLRGIWARPRPSRRVKRSAEVDMDLLLLAFLADDRLGLVLDALALIGLRRPEGADLRGDLADALLVGAADRDAGRLVAPDLDVLRDREDDVVAVAQLQLQVLALHRRAIADAVDLQRLPEALRDTQHQVARQVAGGAPHHAGLLGFADRLDLDLAVLQADAHLVGERQAQLAELALGDQGAA